MTDSIDRRRFLKVLGVTSAGAAAVSACGIGPEPTERLIPYLVQPEDQIPGTATYYATTCRECAAGCGAPGRQSHGVRHRDAAHLRLRECEVRVVVRGRLPRHLALAGRIPERLLARARVRCRSSRIDGKVHVCGAASLPHGHERR